MALDNSDPAGNRLPLATTTPQSGSDAVQSVIDRLREIFRAAPTKHEAHGRATPIMDEIVRDPGFLTSALLRYVSNPTSLQLGNYPVIGMVLESNPDFDLAAHAWIPHPDGDTDLTTKAIHHHGELLLTTGTAFGPGYEHWLFTTPEPLTRTSDRFRMELTHQGIHGLHEVAFVDAYTPHVPLFPADMTITYCLWSTRSESTWRDSLKRVPILQRNSASLRRLVTRAGLATAFEVKNVSYFDFYPGERSMIGIPERDEFQRGPNVDHVNNLFYVLQQTGNEDVAEIIPGGNLPAELRIRLAEGAPIDPRLSNFHWNVPEANFCRADIERVLAYV